MVSETVTQGAVFVISEDMADKSHAFKCAAINYYNGDMHKNSTTVVFHVIRGICLFYLFHNKSKRAQKATFIVVKYIQYT